MAADAVRRPVRRGRRPPEAAGRLEAILARQGFDLVAGVDEVGRGALAGPLVAAAVAFRAAEVPDGLCDSKVLTPEEREVCAEEVLARAVAVAYAVVAPQDIDTAGLHVSNLSALRRAVRALKPVPDYVISDHFVLHDVEPPHVGLPRADGLSAAVAAASIVAKVSRDAFMATLEADHPGYGFARHKGYATPEHWAAIRAFGPSAVHRRSFRGVASWQASFDDL